MMQSALWLGLGERLDPLVLDLLNRSSAVFMLLLAVLLLRFVFYWGPKWLRCLLWALVALRLLLPLHLNTPVSALGGVGIPVSETGQVEFFHETELTYGTGLMLYTPVDGSHMVLTAAKPGAEKNGRAVTMSPLVLLSPFWLLGCLGLLTYALLNLVRLKRKLREAIRLEKGVWLSDRVDTPFLLGLFRPRIYLPADMAPELREPVLRHERAHLSRGDQWWKLLGWLLLCVYWFSPMIWLSWFLYCRDLEQACDERVIRGLAEGERKGYASALLECSLPRARRLLSPLAFGETGVKTRIQAVLNYRRAALWLIIAALVLAAAAAVFLGTDPIAAERRAEAREWTEPALSPDLEAAVHAGLLEKHLANYVGEGLPTEAHVVLAAEEHGSETTVWVYAVHWSLLWNGEDLEETCGGSGPARLTFTTDQGEYVPVNYWQPLGGEKYEQELLEHLPDYISPVRADHIAGQYQLRLNQNCYAQAVAYYRLDPEPLVEGLFTALLSGGGDDPDDCIHHAPGAWQELLYLGNYSARWVVARLLEPETGGEKYASIAEMVTKPRETSPEELRDAVLWRLLQELDENAGSSSAARFNVNAYLTSTRHCFQSWLGSVQKSEAAKGRAWLEQNKPIAALALGMSRGAA